MSENSGSNKTGADEGDREGRPSDIPEDSPASESDLALSTQVDRREDDDRK